MTTPSTSASTPSPALWRRPGLLLAVLAVVIQLTVLYWPVVTVEGPVSWTDKVVHLLVFALPTWAVGRATGSVRLAALVFAVHAPLSEIVQHVVLPGRSGDVGVGLGVLALVLPRVVGAGRRRW